jgi:membrane fusion protein (multidrug efflux system)
MKLLRILAFLGCAAAASAQVETVRVKASGVQRKVPLTGEFLPYQSVSIFARVNGYIERVEVDRGTSVRKGQLLAVLSAPEMTAQLAEAESKVLAVESQRAEAVARLVAAESTYDKLKAASATPGAIAGNELVQAENAVNAAKALVASIESSRRAARSAADAVKDMQAYLRVTAPFEGVITERNIHPGALVGPQGAAAMGPLFKLEQTSRLRLVVAVPESDVGGIVRGASVAFTVPAFPGATFSGKVARIPGSIDPKTRTMPVEMDVLNAKGQLAPGMYPEVSWPVRSSRLALLVPPTAVASTTERTFVIRAGNGRAEWVNVKKGLASGDLLEVFGNISEGDQIVRHATDEIRDGAPIKAKASGPK